jgi:hypothetical protein
MRLTLVLTAIIFTAVLTYAKLLAIADAPPHVYTNTAGINATALRFNSCQQTVNSSSPPAAQSN